MSKLLIKFRENYADEFDVEGHKVFDESEWKQHLEFVQTLKFPREIYFGTNEFIEFYRYEDYVASYRIQFLSDSEYETIKKLELLESGTFLYIEKDHFIDDEEEIDE